MKQGQSLFGGGCVHWNFDLWIGGVADCFKSNYIFFLVKPNHKQRIFKHTGLYQAS